MGNEGLCPLVLLRFCHDTALDALRLRMHPFTTVSPLRYPCSRTFLKKGP